MPMAKWTLKEYHRMIEVGLLDDRLVQLLNGNIMEMEPEDEAHIDFSREIANYLTQQLGDRATIRQGQPITMPSKQSQSEPDLAIVQPLGQEYLQHHPYPENVFWLIEVSDNNIDTDLELKRRIYAMANIPEYWVVDLSENQLWIFRVPLSGDYCLGYSVKEGKISPCDFPDVVVSVQRLLAV